MKNTSILHQPMSKARNGFTLLELLVIIAIITLLAAILFPVFSRVRENARRSSCASNLKQIGLGILQYAQDNDEVMVPIALDGSCQGSGGANSATNSGNCDGVPARDNLKWMDMVYPYIRSEGVFNCPSIGRSPKKYRHASGDNYGHYSANFAYFGPNNTLDNVNPPFSHYRETAPGTFLRNIPINLARIQAPTTTVMVMDARPNAPAPFSFSWDNVSNVSSTSPSLRDVGEDVNDPGNRVFAAPSHAISERHLSTVNVLWTDGHVKGVKLDAIIQTKVVPVKTTNGSPVNKNIYTSWTVEDD